MSKSSAHHFLLKKKRALLLLRAAASTAACACMIGHGAAMADTQAGVTAWESGDYETAVSEWRSSAQAGDADAAYNLGQAYKTGRGVPRDLDLALGWYADAMNKGNVRAADNYGLTLYQMGRKAEAMPYIQTSAGRGEPRAQYVYGAELFNGQLIEKDWVRAYAYMNRASSQGLTPASKVLAEMDQHIPLEERQRGVAMSQSMETAEKQQRYTQYGQWDLKPIDSVTASSAKAPTAASSAVTSYTPPVASSGYQENPVKGAAVKKLPTSIVTQSLPEASASAPVAYPTQPYTAGPAAATAPAYSAVPDYTAPARTPSAVETFTPPSAQPASMATAQPAPVMQTASPPQKGPNGLPAGYTPSVGPSAISATPVRIGGNNKLPNQPVQNRPAARTTALVAAPSSNESSVWRVQMGAYRSLDGAESVWNKYQAKVSDLVGRQPYLVKQSGLVKLQYGPFSSKNEAEASCQKIKSSGGSCFAVKNR